MFKTKRHLCFALILLATPLLAFAIPFNFSYEYSDGTTLSGQLEGEVQSDNETITVIDFSNVSWNGFMFPEISADEILAVSDFQVGALPPIVSFSGNTFDLFVCPMGFGVNNNCSFSSEGGFLFGLMANFG